jgi:WD40 repeat protein
MARRNLTFRVFVSSTFNDLIAERNALQEHAFPRLRDYCQAKRARFQAIDLRWGISKEASLDQQTMEICLQELKRCQQVSPRPNFIVLLGDRYGWRPVPTRIEAAEFEALLERVRAGQRPLLLEWYRRDDNAVPPEYRLQPRGIDVRDARAVREKQAANEAGAGRWSEQVEPLLRSLLVDAARELFPNPDEPRRQRYEDSATHQEIRHGAFQAEDPRSHVFAYFRSIKGLPEDAQAKEYHDVKDGAIDVEAQARMAALKGELRSLLPVEHVYQYTAQWRDGRPNSDLLGLCDRFEGDLRAIIDDELAAFEQAPELHREIEAHREFGRQRADHFVGRHDVLEKIRDYLVGGSNLLFVVHGVSGSGKTALMAQAAQAIAEQVTHSREIVTVSRSIGAAPGSSDVRSLLESVCRQVAQAYRDDRPVPGDLTELIQDLPTRMALATAEQPLAVLLDALDQLSPTDGARSVGWLPRQLPANVKLIVSVLESEGAEGDCDRVLQRLVPVGNRARLDPLPLHEGEELLDSWLREAHRGLQPEQRREVLGKFAANGLPLYLKLAFGEGRRWRSYDAPRSLGADVHGIVTTLLARLEDEKNHGSVLTSRALGYLAAGRHGLTEQELLDLLSADEMEQADFRRRSPQSLAANRLPVVIWSRLLADLEPYLTVRQADHTTVLGFYHRQLQEVALERYVQEADRTRFHRTLASYFDALPMRFQSGYPNLRKLSEIPFQQTRARLWEKVEHTLENLFFLEAKVEASQLFDLANEFQEVLSTMPSEQSAALRELQAALMSDVAWLQGRPQRVFPQIFNHLRWREDGEGSARHLAERLRAQHGSTGREWPRVVMGPPTTYLRTMGADNWTTFFLNALPDGRITSLNTEGSVKVWDPSSGMTWVNEKLVKGHGQVAALRAGRIVFADGQSLTAWDFESGRSVATSGLSGGVQWVEAMANGRVAVGTMDGSIRVWDTENDHEWSLSVDGAGVLCLANMPDGRVACLRRNGTVDVWSPETGDVWTRLWKRGTRLPQGYKEPYSHLGRIDWWWKLIAGLTGGRVAFPLDANGSAGMSHKGVQVWDPDASESWSLEDVEEVRALAALPDGRVAIGGRQCVYVWEARSNRIWAMSGVQSQVNSVGVLPDGRVVSGADDGTVSVWDPDRDDVLTTHACNVRAVAALPDGRIAFADHENVRVWDPGSTRSRRRVGHRWPVRSVSVLDDGHVISEGTVGRLLCFWDPEHERLPESHQLHDGIDFVRALPDGRVVLWNRKEQSLILWDLRSGQTPSYPFQLDKGQQLEHAALLPDGRLLLTTYAFVGPDGRPLRSAHGPASVLDLNSGQVQLLDAEAVSVAVSRDGLIVIAAADGAVKTWDATCNRFHSRNRHSGGVCPPVASSGGLAFFVSEAGTVRATNPATGETWDTRALPSPPSTMMGLGGGRVAFAREQILTVWEPASGRSWCRDDYGWVAVVGSPISARADGRVLYGRPDLSINLWSPEVGSILEFRCSAGLVCAAAHRRRLCFAVGLLNGDVLAVDVEGAASAKTIASPGYGPRPIATAVQIPLTNSHQEGPKDPLLTSAFLVTGQPVEVVPLPPHRLQPPSPTEELPGPNFDEVDLGQLRDGVLRESDPNRRRLVLWVKAGDQVRKVLWLRVSAWGPLRKHRNGGILFAPAKTTMFRQRSDTLLWRMLSSFLPGTEQTCVLPSGRKVERLFTDNRDALIIVSTEGSLDTSAVARLWSASRGVRQLSEKMALAEGVVGQ